jgi:mono/diheme cytochrome c family protein
MDTVQNRISNWVKTAWLAVLVVQGPPPLTPPSQGGEKRATKLEGERAGSNPKPAKGRDELRSHNSTPAIDYIAQVKPILTRHCVECHGQEKPRAGLRLDTAASALKGGKSGPAVLAGQGDESPLIEAVRGDGAIARMPLKRPPLSDAEIKLLETWIDQGAKSPAGELPGVPAKRSHWAFISPVRPVVPEVKRRDWACNAIDRFVLSALERAGLGPSPEASQQTLLRRLSLDLIGLPPSPEETETFVADRAPGAFDRAIDRLMASPHFGERWARPWLDQARYADSNGYNIDAPRAIWKYRDWVIAALNTDMPFDEFAIDQLAGDLRKNASFAQRIATGFHRNTQINQEGGIDVEQFRVESIVDRVNTTGTVFLGLTVGCAQCHDHKYDPLTQRDYYRLFAFFNDVDEPELEIASTSELAKRDQIRAKIDHFHRDLAARYPDLDDRERRWEKTVTLEFTQAQDADVRVAFDSPREKRTPSQRRALVELMLASDATLRAEFAKLVKLRAAEPKFVTTMVVRDRGKPRESFVHLGGDFTRKGESTAPAFPAVLQSRQSGNPPKRLNRMDLARWLTSGRNPLTARVQVNRIWQAYFGRGLVETDNDLGTQGTPPSHPELLDWLACELVDSGWSQKAIHRLIVTSATYRQSSRVREEGQTNDPTNRLLWRQERLRLDAELIRDAALASSGLLSRRIGGPSVFPPQPEGVMTLGQMKRPWRADTGANRYRRGLYTYFWRATPFPFLTTFDAPGGVQTCTRRFRSNTPLQALTLLNDPAFVEIAGGLAARILSDCPDPATDQERLQHAFRLCLAREPSHRELRMLDQMLAGERQDRDDSELGNTDTTAQRSRPRSRPLAKPWLAVARVMLNLDEFVTRE